MSQYFETRYSEDQPRDENGRFSDGGGFANEKISASDFGIETVVGDHPLGSLSKSDYLNKVGTADGLSSEDGSLKHITLYHGSFNQFDEFDYEKGKESKGGGADQYGEGFYFTSDPNVASNFGDYIYTVDVAYSTSRRIAKKTGRKQDFSYDPDTGYWVIPKDASNNLKIIHTDSASAYKRRSKMSAETTKFATQGGEKMTELEKRAAACEVTSAEKDGKHIITGRPIVFDSKTDLGDFDEIIERGALNKTDLKDVRFIVNHDVTKIPLARSRRNNGNSTMKLTQDEKGLLVEAELDTENNAEAKALYSAVKRGDITGMSFMFVVSQNGDYWENLGTEKPTRHIRSIGSVVEVSACTFPAYDDTVISARSAEAVKNAKETVKKAEEEKKQAEEKRAAELELLKAKTTLLSNR